MRSVICQRFNGTTKLNINGVFCFRFEDFAGSGVVHIFAATCSLIGCYIIGPRTGRFVQGAPCSEIQRHSLPLTSLGGFILMFGFLAFNGGSQVATSYIYHSTRRYPSFYVYKSYFHHIYNWLFYFVDSFLLRTLEMVQLLEKRL